MSPTSTEAPARPSSGPFALTSAYYVTFAAMGLVTASLGPTIPALAANTGSTLGGISYLFTLRSLGYVAGSFVAGRIYDRAAGNPVLAAALLAQAAFMALVPFVGVLPVLLAVVWAIGFCEATTDVGGNTLLPWVHGEKIAPWMNGLHFFFGVGAFLSPLVVAQGMRIGGSGQNGNAGLVLAYVALAALIAPAAIFLLRLPSPRPRHAVGERPADGRDRALAVLIAAYFLVYVGAEVGLGGWIYTYARALELADATSAAYLNSAFWGAFTLGRLIAIPVAAWLLPRTIIALDIAGCAASVVVVLAYPGSLAALWIGMIGAGASLASMFPTMLNLASRYMRVTGRATSVFLIGASLGSMTLPWIVGQLFANVGPRVVMLAVLGEMAVDAVIFAVILRRFAARAAQRPG